MGFFLKLPYGTMSDDEMRKLAVPQLQDEGYIFLWVTGRYATMIFLQSSTEVSYEIQSLAKTFNAIQMKLLELKLWRVEMSFHLENKNEI